MSNEITDEQRTVLQIKFKDGGRFFLAKANYIIVSDPYNATRYPPIDDEFPKRKESQDEDKNWMEGCYDAEISFISFVQACLDYKNACRNVDWY